MTTVNEREHVEGAGEIILTWIGRSLWLLILWWLLPLLLPNLMSGALLGSEQLAWFVTRASGTIAYLTMAASTIWGLLLSTKIVKELIPAPVSLSMHKTLSWTAIGLTILHAGALLFDGYYTYTIANLLIPFTGPYLPFWVGLGIITLYIMVISSVSFYARRWIGQKNWRRLHYLTFGAFILSTLHGVWAGSDTAGLSGMYIVSGLLVLFLTIYRLLSAVTAPKRPVRVPRQARS